MGFNKRYINKESVLGWYKHGGSKQVHDMYVKADVLILSGSVAEDIELIIYNTPKVNTRLKLIDDYFDTKLNNTNSINN